MMTPIKSCSSVSLDDLPLTSDAREVVESIFPRLTARGLPIPEGCIPMEIVVWSILRWERKVAVLALEKLGVVSSRLEDAMNIRLEERAQAIKRTVTLPGLVKYDKFLLNAADWAKASGHTWVGTEHLLLAAIALADRDLTIVFESMSIERKALEDAIASVIGKSNR